MVYHRQYMVIYSILIAILAILTISNMNGAVISDEIFSLELVVHSWTEMVTLAMADVHPPLYYLILKVFIDLFSGGDPERSIIIGKFVAMLPSWILFLLSATMIRNHHGRRVSVLFSTLLIGLPTLIHVTSLIRMYSWGMLFITLAGVFAASIMQGRDEHAVWIGLLLSSVAACYTHYFCDVAIFYIYLWLLLWMICHRKDLIRHLLLNALLVVVAFLPWLGILAGQVGSVSDSYWIPEITGATILDYCKTFLAPYMDASMIRISLEILMGVIVILAIATCIRRGSNGNVPLYLMSIVGSVIVTGIAVSMVFRPIFVARYAIPSSGLFALGLAIAATRMLPEEWPIRILPERMTIRYAVSALALLILMGTAAINLLSYVKNEWIYRRNYNALEIGLLAKVRATTAAGERTVVYTDSTHVMGALAYLLQDSMIYGVGFDVTPYAHQLTVVDNIAAYSDEGIALADRTWLVHASDSDDALLQIVDLDEITPWYTTLEQITLSIYDLNQH